MCGIYGIMAIGGANGRPPETLDRMGAVDPAPRARRFRRVRGRRLAARHAAPVDHRRRRRAPARSRARTGRSSSCATARSTTSVNCGSNWRPAGHRFATHSDSEVVVHAYEEYGDAFLDRLEGMFGLAVWDRRRRRLLVARDAFGIKPIYYAATPKELIFASEAKAILAVPGQSARLDPAALAQYPRGRLRLRAELDLRRHAQARAGHACWSWSGAGSQTRRYYRMPPSIDTERTEAQWIDELRAQLERAVHDQMVSDVPIGAFLSGGIDSSAVVAFMSRHSAAPGQDVFDRLPGVERRGALQRTAVSRGRSPEQFGTDHHEIVVQPDVVDAAAAADLAHGRADLRRGVHDDLPRLEVRAARRHGDSVGRGRRRTVRRIQALPRRALPQRLPAHAGCAASRPHRAARARAAERPAHVDCSTRCAWRRHSCWPTRCRSSSATRPTCRCSTRRSARQLLRARRGTISTTASPAASRSAQTDDPLRQLMDVDFATQLPDDLLLLTDKMSMAVSLECRVPLLDQRLVELAARMPGSLKMRGGELKHVLKRGAGRTSCPTTSCTGRSAVSVRRSGAWLRAELAPMLKRRAVDANRSRAAGCSIPTRSNARFSSTSSMRADRTDHLLGADQSRDLVPPVPRRPRCRQRHRRNCKESLAA